MVERLNVISESYKTYPLNNKKTAKKKYIPIKVYRMILEEYADLLIETLMKTGNEIKIAEFIGCLQFVNIKKNMVNNKLTKEMKLLGYLKQEEYIRNQNENTNGYWFKLMWNKRAKKGNYRKYNFILAHRNKFKKTRNPFNLIEFYREKGWKILKIK